MPQNIEIKARVSGFDSLRQRLEDLTGGTETVLHQHDTFFYSPTGRLKLRRFSNRQGELIHYHRPDSEGPKRSDFRRLPLEDPDYFAELLSATLGIRGMVEKIRYLYKIGQTRVHLDQVNGLGNFIELEVVLEDGQSPEDGRAIAEEIMTQLTIGQDTLIDRAYIDLLENRQISE